MRFVTSRQLTLFFSIGLFALLCIWIAVQFPLDSLRIIKLSQWTALLSLAYLFASLAISPFLVLWIEFPYRSELTSARRAIGVSGWGFALIHGLVGFFGQLGGLSGLPFLTSRYSSAVVYGFVALLIFSLMTLTSTDKWMQRLTFRYWKLLHRLSYIATVLSVIHALMLGTHFRSLSETIPVLFLFAGVMLGSAECIRFLLWITRQQNPILPLRTFLAVVILMLGSGVTYMQYGKTNNLSVHPAHTDAPHISNTPHGNPTYTLQVIQQDSPQTGKPASLQLQVKNFQTGELIKNLIPNHEKIMHLVAVDDSLTWFSHTHPRQEGSSFSDTLTFPHPGVFYLFATVQEAGKIETTATATVFVGGKATKQPIAKKPAIEIALSSPPAMNLGTFLTGQEKITFRVQDASTHTAVEKLDPYLGTIGHLVMIRQGTLDYIHIHPVIDQTFYQLQSNSTRTIPFAPPIGHAGLRNGSYKLFAEFSVHDTIYSQTFDFELR